MSGWCGPNYKKQHLNTIPHLIFFNVLHGPCKKHREANQVPFSFISNNWFLSFEKKRKNIFSRPYWFFKTEQFISLQKSLLLSSRFSAVNCEALRSHHSSCSGCTLSSDVETVDGQKDQKKKGGREKKKPLRWTKQCHNIYQWDASYVSRPFVCVRVCVGACVFVFVCVCSAQTEGQTSCCGWNLPEHKEVKGC